MKTLRHAALAATAFSALVGLCGSANADVSPIDGLTIGGRLKEGVALAYDGQATGGGIDVGQTAYLAEIRASWRPRSTITFTADFWIRGDTYVDTAGNLITPGTQNYASPNFLGRFGMYENRHGNMPNSLALNPNSPANPYGVVDRRNQVFDNFNEDMIRDFAVQFTDPQDRYSIKIGKFVRAWGQSDGIRLLDVLQAQDYRQKFILGDADEMRIPTWMTAVDLNLERLGMGAPLDAIGLENPQLELIYMPETAHDLFTINVPTSETSAPATSGGLYGLPFPAIVDNVSRLGIPFVGAIRHDKAPNRFAFDEPTLGGRFKFQALGGKGTLNWLYGYQEMPILKVAGSHLIVGNPYGDASHALAVVPLTVAQTEFAVQAAYLPYLRSGAATAAGFQNYVFGAIPGSPCSSAGPTCSVNVDFNFDYHYRRNLIGGSFTRDMVEIPLGPKGVTPVLRTEFSYEFGKPFTRATAVTIANPAVFGIPGPPIVGSTGGSGALVVDPSRSIVKRDQLSVMVGADYFLWLPFWKNQEQSIFTSIQVFTIDTINGDDLVFQSPYAAKLNEVQNYVTLLLDTALDHGRLGVNTLAVVDVQNDGWALRQRFDLNYFGDHWRPRIELSHYESNPERGVLGFMQHANNVEFSLTYQF